MYFQLLRLQVEKCSTYTTCDECIGGNGERWRSLLWMVYSGKKVKIRKIVIQLNSTTVICVYVQVTSSIIDQTDTTLAAEHSH